MKFLSNNANLSVDNSQSFKYKAALAGKTADAVNNTNMSVKKTNIVVPLKYVSNFWRSLEMSLINCKVYLELNWIKGCILSSGGGSAKFKLMGAKLHVTLFTKDNANLTKQSNDGFKRPFYWSNYQTIPAKVIKKRKSIYELLSASFQGFKRLFVLSYFIGTNNANNEAGIKNNKKSFLLRGEFNNHNVLIDERNFYYQPNSDLLKQYDEVRKVSTGKDYDYTIGCLLDYAYFKDSCRLIAVVLSKQKALDADPREIQEIVSQGVVGGADNTKIRLYTILEKSKETVWEFYKGTAKVLWIV